MSYAPLDDGVPTSTVSVCGGPIILAVWTLILASKDQDGVTKLTPLAVEALWSRSKNPLPLATIQEAWDYLAAPDAGSANKAHEGRRIIPTEDGRWAVVSHHKYRDRYKSATLKAAATERKQLQREREAKPPKQHDYTSPKHQECLRDDLGASEPPPEEPPMEERAAWLLAVEEAVAEAIPGYRLEGNDVLLAGLWYGDQIPLRVALEAIKGASKPAPGVEREIRSLAYFTGPVRDEWARVRRGGTV